MFYDRDNENVVCFESNRWISYVFDYIYNQSGSNLYEEMCFRNMDINNHLKVEISVCNDTDGKLDYNKYEVKVGKVKTKDLYEEWEGIRTTLEYCGSKSLYSPFPQHLFEDICDDDKKLEGLNESDGDKLWEWVGDTWKIHTIKIYKDKVDDKLVWCLEKTTNE